MTRSNFSILETVYPPISNQEAVWLQNDSEVEDLLRTSDFYMIAARTEAKFLNIDIDPVSQQVGLTFTIGETFADKVKLRIQDLPGVAANPGHYRIEAGEKIIRICSIEGKRRSRVLEWFTTEKLIWNRARGRHGIEGFERYREAANYNLLYIGIAKVGDSFDRLFKNGHKARTDILANEPQRAPGARVTDEVYIFMFRVHPITIKSIDLPFGLLHSCAFPTIAQKRVVADAEKALVSLLEPQYNIVKFVNYPKGADGLYASEYQSYGYMIGEDVTFNTAHGRIRGARLYRKQDLLKEVDIISIEGDTVTLYGTT